MNVQFMAYAGGIPTFLTIGFFIFTMFFLTKKKGLSIKKVRIMKNSSKLANKNHSKIKEELRVATPLVKFRFYLLVGKKRYNDYMYQG
jgi:hypothetical protein